MSAKFGRIGESWAVSAKVGPSLTNLERFRPNSCQIWQTFVWRRAISTSLLFGQTWPVLGQLFAILAEFGPNLADVSPNLVFSTEAGPISANTGPKLGRVPKRG